MRRLELVCDLGVLKRNALEIRKRVPQSVKMLCVVKADAYGHGAVQTARTLLDAGLADAFAVATPEEGLELYESGLRDKPIVVLGQISDYADAILSAQCGLSQAVDSPKNAELMDGAAAQTGKTAKLHIKIDSGMNRTGVKGEDELRRLLDEIKTLRNVKVEGLFTHFCAADEDEAFTKQQNAAFAKAKEICGEYGFMPVCHAAASTAMLHREYQYDMVRAGTLGGRNTTFVVFIDGLGRDSYNTPCKRQRACLFVLVIGFCRFAFVLWFRQQFVGFGFAGGFAPCFYRDIRYPCANGAVCGQNVIKHFPVYLVAG